MGTKTKLGAIAAAAMFVMMAPAASWAESASRSGDPADFLTGATCPPPAGAPCFDASAGGAKIFGTLTVVYDKEPKHPSCPTAPNGAFVKNMYVNLTLETGNVRVPFSTDYLQGPPAHPEGGFCLLTNSPKQVAVIIELIRAKVIPFFYGCDPDSGACPAFRVKAITNFQYTTAHPNLAPYPYSGGFSADITIAAQ